MTVITKLWILAAIVVGAQAQDLPKPPAFKPGREVAAKWPGLEKGIVVYVPTNYDSKRTWPCIFYFPGTHAPPNTHIMRVATKGRDFVLIGMDYHIFGPMTATRGKHKEIRLRDYKTYKAVRAWLGQSLKIDEKRVYTAGASKGGWVAASMGEMDLKNIAGMIILMAGRQYWQPLPEDARLLKGKPIYIGIGEFDPTNCAAHWGREFYLKQGAKVCLEDYMGIGHSASFESGLLPDWLDVEGRLNARPKNMTAELKRWINARTKAITAEADPAKRYHMLNLLSSNPKLALCSSEMKKGLRKLWSESIKAGTPGAKERDAETAFRKLVYRERNWWRANAAGRPKASEFSKIVSELVAIDKEYGAIARKYSKTRFGKRSQGARKRLAASLADLKDKLQSVKDRKQ